MSNGEYVKNEEVCKRRKETISYQRILQVIITYPVSKLQKKLPANRFISMYISYVLRYQIKSFQNSSRKSTGAFIKNTPFNSTQGCQTYR